ncbi:MAG: vitamin B12-dependent ribonucleotide reductase, partial [Planctomycetaceae bacterium]
PAPFRRHLPATRRSLTHKFSVGGHEGYATVGLFEDGKPGELFITMAKEGSTIGGLMDTVGTLTSLALQYGVPLEALVNKFSHMRFEPSGWTGNADIPNAKSVPDYIFRWAGMEFIDGFREENAPRRGSAAVHPPLTSEEEAEGEVESFSPRLEAAAQPRIAATPKSATVPDGPKIRSLQFAKFQADAPGCDNCGAITVRNGNCYLCHNCGNSMGCS